MNKLIYSIKALFGKKQKKAVEIIEGGTIKVPLLTFQEKDGVHGSGWILRSTDDLTPLKERNESTLRASNHDDTK